MFEFGIGFVWYLARLVREASVRKWDWVRFADSVFITGVANPPAIGFRLVSSRSDDSAERRTYFPFTGYNMRNGRRGGSAVFTTKTML